MRLVLWLALVLSVAGCASYTPFDPPRAGEIPRGPGLLSGEDTQFTIYRR